MTSAMASAAGPDGVRSAEPRTVPEAPGPQQRISPETLAPAPADPPGENADLPGGTANRTAHGSAARDPRSLLSLLARGDQARSGRHAGGHRTDPPLTHVEQLAPRAAVTADWPAWTPEPLRTALGSLGIPAPWAHQVRAAELARAGEHVVIATGTGSGKTLAYQLPVLSGLLDDPRNTAIYLSPTKALAADQLRTLTRLTLPGVRPAGYDGDTPQDERVWVRQHARLVLTNPDMLHRAILPRHATWATFLRRLTFVVVDECHTYRGVFGSHVAHVLRRLRRIAARYGSEPVFLLASATVAEPAASASVLTGLPVRAITEDTSPHGGLTFALWEPPLLPAGSSARPSGRKLIQQRSEPEPAAAGAPGVADLTDPRGDRDGDGVADLTDPRGDRDGDGVADGSGAGTVRKSALRETADLLTDSVVLGARTLAFVRSRRGAEVVATMARRALAEVAPELADRVAAYRAGYLREERRSLEQRLLSGSLLGLASTNALELGVDLAGLDAVVLGGYPGTLASMWQQAGRAGRAGRNALCVLVARDDPLDTYLVRHPEALFGRPVERTVLDPANPYVLGPHLCCAAAEMPLTVADFDLFGGPPARQTADGLVAAGVLRRRPTGWYWTGRNRPDVDLRGTGGSPVAVVEGSTGRLLGTVDAGSAHFLVHSGAVYLHQGSSYVVDDLDLDDACALVHAEEPDWSTHARDVTSLSVVEVTSYLDAGPVGLFLGTVDVRSQVVSYQRRRIVTGEVLDTRPLDLPARQLRTVAVWWTISPTALAEAGVDAADVPGALHAAEHAAIGLLPLVATCDRWDIGGLSTAIHPDTGTPTVFVYDGHPGGAGFAERAYRVAVEWLSATRAGIAGCGCETGCPSCVQSPKCGNGNEPLAKSPAVRVLDAVLAALDHHGTPAGDDLPSC